MNLPIGATDLLVVLDDAHPESRAEEPTVAAGTVRRWLSDQPDIVRALQAHGIAVRAATPCSRATRALVRQLRARTRARRPAELASVAEHLELPELAERLRSRPPEPQVTSAALRRELTAASLQTKDTRRSATLATAARLLWALNQL